MMLTLWIAPQRPLSEWTLMSAVNVAHSINNSPIGLPLDCSLEFFSLLWPILLSANRGVNWMDCSLDSPLDPNCYADYTPWTEQ